MQKKVKSKYRVKKKLWVSEVTLIEKIEWKKSQRNIETSESLFFGS